jgi:hypothetical protein
MTAVLGAAGLCQAEGVNCTQVNKYLQTGRSVKDVAETMVISEDDVKKCQAEAPQGGAAPAGEETADVGDRLQAAEHPEEGARLLQPEHQRHAEDDRQVDQHDAPHRALHLELQARERPVTQAREVEGEASRLEERDSGEAVEQVALRRPALDEGAEDDGEKEPVREGEDEAADEILGEERTPLRPAPGRSPRRRVVAGVDLDPQLAAVMTALPGHSPVQRDAHGVGGGAEKRLAPVEREAGAGRPAGEHHTADRHGIQTEHPQQSARIHRRILPRSGGSRESRWDRPLLESGRCTTGWPRPTPSTMRARRGWACCCRTSARRMRRRRRRCGSTSRSSSPIRG